MTKMELKEGKKEINKQQTIKQTNKQIIIIFFQAWENIFSHGNTK